MTGFYRSFIQNYSTIAKPLTDLTQHDVKFKWTDEEQLALDKLKSSIINAPVLKIGDPLKPYYITTDASNIGIGAVLEQEEDKKMRPVAFYSHKLNLAERKMATHEKEMLAVVLALKQFRSYYEGKQVTVYTDHCTLQHFLTQQNMSAKFMRWHEYVSEVSPLILYKPGRTNLVADCLSRDPRFEENDKNEELNNISILESNNINDEIIQAQKEDEYVNN